jgi:cytochrome c oxidase assembly protein subunit 15
MRALRWTAGAALVLTYALIVLGAGVRATGSGLSCPDWPTCYGHWVPLPGEIPPEAGYSYFQVMLEWVHRLLAGVILGPLILAIGVLCWRAREVQSRMPVYGALLLLLLLVQALLGGVTVLDQNSPWSVALHLTTALVLFSVLWLIFERAGQRAALSNGIGRVARPLAGLVWLLALGTMASAAMTTKSGAALACSTWPLCDGALIPDLGDPLVRLNFTHRLLAAATGLGVAALWFATRWQPLVQPLVSLALGLVLAEILVGALVVLWQVPIGTAVAHQALGVLAFGAITWSMWRISAPASDAEGAHVRRLSRA